MNSFSGKPHGRPTTPAAKGAAGLSARRRRPSLSGWFRRVAAGAAVVIPVAMMVPPVTAQAVAPPGNGFVVTAGDLTFVLKQIKIAERHSATFTSANPCGTLVGPASDQIPDALTSYGLRTVDGSCNNLFPGRETFAAADQPFPRLAPAKFRDAEPITPAFPVGPPGPTSYKQKLAGNVVIDSEPRTVSNLVVDQTSTNPAAVAAAGAPVRSQQNPGLFPCTTDPDPTAIPPIDAAPVGCVPAHQTLFIPNVTTDVGLSPPYNSMFTFFGQFFDHGVDQTVKSGGTVFVPLKADDALITLGPDGKANTGDEVQPSQAFMVLTRAQNQPGPDKVLGTADDITDSNNTDSPWVDQSQTYTSHSSHQVFLREYSLVAGKPLSTGKLLGGLPAGQTYPGSPDGQDGIGTWAAVKKQAAEKLGLRLLDRDVTNIPMLATDPYGNFLPGPARGLPQYVTTTGLIEGNIAAPVAVPANVRYFDTPFLTDIAHNADPSPQDTDNNPATPPVAPTPDADTVPSADFAHQPAGTYDDEMLNAHFSCGDGRCNENIALSTIHQVFHSEHDRLVDDMTNTLNDPANAALLAAFRAPHQVDGAGPDVSFGFGGRLFQAARFVTEMEYQHLVFEEFGRKMVPAIRPFHVYSPDINPATDAEFAHAVYRFGHSMLDDDVARSDTRADGSRLDNSLPLLTAFLNPPELFDNKVDPAHPVYTPKEAAGAIVMGSSDQVGNELDEFVTETLRNNLLGLPLDLPTLNITRARDAGVPRLNEFRRSVFSDTNDGQLIPYTSWSDFGQHLKHPESLINFVAAYGQHPSITSATTLKAKRDAARAIVDPLPTDVQPADAADFMFSRFGTPWANAADGSTTTGLDDVDLWVGGLAEVTNLFGGLLGSTFNYVFQTQMEKLQDGDRLYYLARTPGMNLRTQLEGNSFSEIIQRNTDGADSLKADAFATADCKFQLARITPFSGLPTSSLPPLTAITSAGAVNDDPNTTDCDENQLLVRSPDGTISYRQRNAIDPTGINGQSVYNGTPAADKVKGGNDNDTFWGGAGNDVIDGQGGDDIALGGEGDDIITDLDGADVPKGGPGNDAIDAGPGNDIVMGNEGQDFLNAGANDNETFAGPGNDFIIAGLGADAVFGDGGDDWIEGGSGQDLLQGDHGAPFFDDPAETAPGNDIFIGQVGENDYDAEGGDDVMAQNAAVDRNAGAAGFDWAIHQYDTVAAVDDMMINNNLGGLPIQLVTNRDRWQETEADSGGPLDDSIKGTDGVLATPRLIDARTGGFSGCDAIDQAGLARINGLSAILPPVAQWQGTAAAVAALSASGSCPLTGPVWGEGDILLGGGGSDTLEGRAGNEIIDGDRYLTTRISYRTNPADPATETGTTDLMENKAIPATATNPWGPGTTGMTLQQAVFAGIAHPGNLVAVRDIKTAAAEATAVDTAVFSGPPSTFTVTPNANGSITVDSNGGIDGVDTLFNIENLRFCLATDAVTKLCTATQDVPVGPATPIASVTPAALAFANQNVATTSASQAITVTDTGPLPLVVSGVTVTGTDAASFTATPAAGCASVAPASSCTVNVTFAPTTAGAKAATVTISDNAPGSPHTVRLTGTGVAVATVPGAPTGVLAVAANASANVRWTAPASNGGSAITGYSVRVIDAAGAQVGALRPAAATANTLLVTGLTNGQAYRFSVAATNAIGTGAFSAQSAAVTLPTAPGAPTGVSAVRGNTTATVGWTAPAGNGGSAITGYSVRVVNAAGGQVGALRPAAAAARSLVVTGLTNGQAYRFSVTATNAIGTSAASALSAAVTPATVPGAPVIGTASAGVAGGTINATARWAAPASTGGAAITGYRVSALRMSATGAVLATTNSAVQASTVRALTMTLPVAGNYRFTVVAINAVGTGPASARSNLVAGR